MFRVCSICNQLRASTDFYLKDRSKNRLHSQCKSCYNIKRKAIAKSHYKKYGDVYRERARARKSEQKLDRQNRLYDYLKNKQCTSCGNNDIRVLDFDHINPSDKLFGIARAVNDGYSWSKIEKEIKKCRILCANCYRIVTAQQQRWRKSGALAEKLGTALQKLEDGGGTRTHLHKFDL